MTDEMRERDDLSDTDLRDAEDIEREVVVVRGPRTPVDRRDALEGVVPDATDEPQSTARPNFARGQEDDPGNLERLVEDRFSRGQEEIHAAPAGARGRLRDGPGADAATPRDRARWALRARPAAERRREPERGLTLGRSRSRGRTAPVVRPRPVRSVGWRPRVSSGSVRGA